MGSADFLLAFSNYSLPTGSPWVTHRAISDIPIRAPLNFFPCVHDRVETPFLV